MAQYTLHMSDQERDDIVAALELSVYNPHGFDGRERRKIILDRLERLTPDRYEYGGRSNG